MIVSRDAEKTLIRFPPGMIARLTEAARKAGRSRNTEIVKRLAESLAADARRERRKAA